ncbi:hypothetical protein [Arthrobacter sp. 260]|uniref:hypothetical protein n=1 Tax=Arthrobacter sp. 260 TaxID=2735314 RepID=UPI0014910699|nr:hypothetical protein [Arthrobacter sp. 260]NOJ61163.1 hypothetical protein [Arthrobacter sp. 260]
MSTVPAFPSARIFDRVWTPSQLRAIHTANMVAQTHIEHHPARLALAKHGISIDRRRISAMVADVMGGIDGTYWITSALCHAHLAISFPLFLTKQQEALLLRPLCAGEMAVEEEPEAVLLGHADDAFERTESPAGYDAYARA